MRFPVFLPFGALLASLLFGAPFLHGKGKESGEGREAAWAPSPAPTVEIPDLYLAKTRGTVAVVSSKDEKGKEKRRRAEAPEALRPGDRVLTGKQATAWLQFREGGTLELGSRSEVVVGEAEVKAGNLRAFFSLAAGRLRAMLEDLSGASSRFEIEAGGMVTGVRGTSYEVEYDPKQGTVQARTYQGEVFARAGEEETVLTEGKAAVFKPEVGLSVGGIDAQDLKDFTEFLNVAGDLEKKKEILQRQLEKRLLEKLTGGILGTDQKGRKSIRFGF